jgi:hypothetical protein
LGPELFKRYSDSLQIGRFGARNAVTARHSFFSTPVNSNPGAQPASCTMVPV